MYIKRILAAFLSAVMIVVMIPAVGVSAATNGNFTYDIVDGDACITKVATSVKGNVTVPDTLGGHSVTSISPEAFLGCTSMTGVIVPDSVTYIGYNAFGNCTGLQSITLPFVGESVNGNGNTHFGYIFGADSDSYNKTYVPSSLKEVVVTGGTMIASRAFYGCYYLTNISIPNSVTQIGSYAFYYCSALKTLSIPFVGINANGSGNKDFGIIFGNKEFGHYPIPSTLSTVIVTGNSDIAAEAFHDGCSSIKTIQITGNTSKIGRSAFWDCTSLSSITLPDSVTQIGYGILNSTEYYDNAYNWKNGVLYVGNYLIDTKSLSGDYTVKDGTTVIADQAFINQKSITSITIPKSVVHIGDDAFKYTDISDVYFGGTKAAWNEAISTAEAVGLSDANIHYGEHIIVNNGQIDATCTTDGYTGDRYCSDCGMTFSLGTTVPATGHRNTEVTSKTKATCTKSGYTGDTYCNDCSTVIKKGESIPATGHLNTEIIDKADATCKKTGYSGDTYCNDCDRIIETGNVIPVTDHIPGEWVVLNEEECRTCSCTVCGTEIKRTAIVTSGDANIDGKVNLSDVSVILKHIAKWDVQISTDAADVTVDNKVNLADVSLILKYIAKWDVII